MSIWQMINTGGVTMYILIAVSILSIAIIFERVFYYSAMLRVKRLSLMERITAEVKKNNIQSAIGLCSKEKTCLTKVVSSGLELAGRPANIISNGMERTIAIETVKLEKFTSILGTIGSTAVYIGLFGTVLGIIRAFNDISKSGSGGLNIVISGISEALVCTAAGLCVAVPAVIAYNFFVKKIDRLITEMELCASETLDLLNSQNR
ncbi:MAG: MotA/TolQ/ExbB proton channel family protein [Candidatus Omnitrophica bacterium]|nr:MotA/TolQ/ExbB proton channel family protein [Candidatus Omnitrophota bacterium]